MKKLPLILGVTFVTIVVIFYAWSAMKARKMQQDTLAKFNEVNRELKSRLDSINAQQRIADAQNNLPIGIMNSKIILLIDSLKDTFQSIDNSTSNSNSAKLERDLKRLLKYIQEVNRLKWDMMDSNTPDTIQYWPTSSAFNEGRWLSMFLKPTPKEASITFLNYLRQQAIANND